MFTINNSGSVILFTDPYQKLIQLSEIKQKFWNVVLDNSNSTCRI